MERTLARSLRRADDRARRALYAVLYDELFRRVPDHPQLTRRLDLEERQRRTQRQLGLFASLLHPELRFLELGAGDCALSCEVAERVARVYAVDVSRQVAEPWRAPENLQLIVANACELPLAPQSVDLVYSDQVIEHLHPEDAEAALRETRRVLVPGGRCVCVTPPRITGPHDISKYFSRVATGFHLKEYSGTELHRLFREAGFSRIGFMIPTDGGSRVASIATYRLVETGLSALPFGMRLMWSERGALSRFFPIRIVAEA